MTEGAYQILLSYAFRALAQRRHSVFELEKKLAKKDIGGEEVRKQVIARLKDLKYLDDDEFVKSYIETRTESNPKGKFLLKKELGLKGIPEELVEKTWEELKINEEDLARKIIKKKTRALSALQGQKKKEKLFYYLSSRGFSRDVIYEILQKI